MRATRRVKAQWLAGLALALVAGWVAWTPLGLRHGQKRATRWLGQAEWGAGAVVLGPPTGNVPGTAPDGPGWRGAAQLDRFWLRAGRGEPTIGTRARITWDEQALYVGAECAEPDTGYRPSRSGVTTDPLVPLPDRLELQFCGDWQGPAWLYSLGADGRQHLRWRPAGWWYVVDREQPAQGVSGQVERAANGWRAVVVIPWRLLGGRPRESFGLAIIRCHDRSGEQSSPVALDWPEWPTASGMLECSFGSRARVHVARGTLGRLPSGVSVWQRPARLARATPAERRRLLDLRGGLRGRTTAASLAERVHWAQRWYEQLVLDGYSFFGVDVLWKPAKGEWHPHEARVHVSRALRRGDVAQACRIVDTFLGQLDRATRVWYADGTLGDSLADAWTTVDSLGPPRLDGPTAHFALSAGAHRSLLRAALMEIDGVRGWRLQGHRAGRFEGGDPVPLRLLAQADGALLSAGDGAGPRLRYRRAPWRVELLAEDGEAVWAVDGHSLALAVDSRGGLRAIDLRGALWSNEAVVGGGERFDALDQRGKAFSLWGEDAWDGSMRGVANQSYKPIPLWQSSRGWSLFWATSYRLRCDLGASAADQMRFTARGDVLDWWLWATPPERTVRAFTALTGRALVPPRWAMAPWMGGNRHRWRVDPRGDPVRAMLEDARRYRDLDLPLGAAYVEAEPSADRRVYDGLRALGVRPVAWSDSHVPRVAQLGGILGQTPEARQPLVALPGGRRCEWIDFTHAAAPGFLRAAFRQRLAWGLSGCMVDYGDILPEDALLADGRRGDEAHNQYGVDYAEAFHATFSEVRGTDFVLIGRPMGPGAQRFAVPFAGDQPASFRGLRQMITAAASGSASGFGLFTGDIGLFAGLPDREVFVRSLQFGAFQALMRSHGWTPREPWRYGDDVTRVYRRFAWLRMSLLDYLHGAALDAAASGLPALRAPLYDWPRLPDAWHTGDQFLCGHDLLLAPVLDAARTRSVWLPPGRWVDLWTGAVQSGPRRVEAAAPLDRLPLYLRPGTLLPLRLPPSLVLGDSLSSGGRRALLLTPPEQDREVALPLDGRRTRTAHLERAEDGFVLRLPPDEPATLLVLMGGRLRSARLGGVELPRVEQAERTLITVPAGGSRSISCRLLAGAAGNRSRGANS